MDRIEKDRAVAALVPRCAPIAEFSLQTGREEGELHRRRAAGIRLGHKFCQHLCTFLEQGLKAVVLGKNSLQEAENTQGAGRGGAGRGSDGRKSDRQAWDAEV